MNKEDKQILTLMIIFVVAMLAVTVVLGAGNNKPSAYGKIKQVSVVDNHSWIFFMEPISKSNETHISTSLGGGGNAYCIYLTENYNVLNELNVGELYYFYTRTGGLQEGGRFALLQEIKDSNMKTVWKETWW